MEGEHNFVSILKQLYFTFPKQNLNIKMQSLTLPSLFCLTKLVKLKPHQQYFPLTPFQTDSKTHCNSLRPHHASCHPLLLLLLLSSLIHSTLSLSTLQHQCSTLPPPTP